MELSHEPGSYPECTSTLQETNLQFEVTNCFEALGELDDDEVFLNAVELSIGSDTEKFSSFVAKVHGHQVKKDS